jgi:methylated-DNA-[protein]-cysteine S-methyltransferase
MEFAQSLNSPIGLIHVYSTDKAITKLIRSTEVIEQKPHKVLGQAQKQLSEYFEGNRKVFELPLDISAGTIFQQSVWTKLLNVGYGIVKSYSDLAIACGDIKKVRAVGKANGANPIPIIIPCHRIIGKNAKLVGYSGGLDMKKYLLKLEKAPLVYELF